MSTPFLSIIVPVYNVEPYLACCLDSILAQTFADFEVLLIDDGSTDASGSICDDYAKKDSRIRCLHQENGGHMSARQAGFRQASGEYVTFVDSDDWIDPSMYQAMCAAANKYDADVICCNYTAVTPEKEIRRLDFCTPGFYDRQRLEEEIYPNMLFTGSFFHYGISPSLCNKLFRRRLFEKHLFQVPLSLKLGEDGLAVYSCLLEASSVCFLPEAFYYYRSSSSSLTHTMDRGRLAENHLLFTTYDKLIDLSAHPCMERQLLYYYVYQCLLTFPPVFHNEPESGHSFKKEFRSECSYPPI
ncbi:MAG: glycosyltransferase, partial [Lachnospiraceae bacterium]|nr:glycosyltransferase [Lachnospiraceae bacterium]